MNLPQHYDDLAQKRDWYRNKNRYYYELLYKQYRFFIPEGKRVLEIGCSTGDLLDAVKPALGVGIDLSDESVAIAKKKFPHLKFFHGEIGDFKEDVTFDYIILGGVLGEVDDIQKLMQELKRFCTPSTRIIIEYYSYLWQYILKIGEALNLKIPQRIQNWLSCNDIDNFLNLADFEPIRRERTTLFPVDIPVFSYLVNRYIAKLPIINALTLNHFIIARPKVFIDKEYSVSILVPCRDEKGNIEAAIVRTPGFGSSQEFIFVEGNSKDGTYEEIQRVIQKYPKKNIKLLKQIGKGKGDAVRLGFSQAQGDVLMILDADLTVEPEELPKFYEALRTNKGEFINGCRLVYAMEKEAMQFLNLVANKFFGIFFSWLLGQKFKDTLCGTKVLFKNQYEEISRGRAYFGDFDPFGDFDLIFGATKLNLKVLELPIRYRSRQYGQTKIRRFREGIILFRMCYFAMRKIKFP